MKILTIPMLLACPFLFSQKPSQKGSLFAGFEAGANIADNSPYNEISGQGGVAGEYFFANQWSVAAKAKYNQVNVNKSTAPFRSVDYASKNIILPVNIKWNYRIYRTFYGSLNVGPVINFKLSSDGAATGTDLKDSGVSLGGMYGAGFRFHFQNGNVLYANYDYYRGKKLSTLEAFIMEINARPANHHISVGYLWKFK